MVALQACPRKNVDIHHGAYAMEIYRRRICHAVRECCDSIQRTALLQVA